MQVYVALLEKIRTLCDGCFEESEISTEKGETWITLGHFDAMHTYELPLKNNNLFQAIHENNSQIAHMQREDRYFHPLYLISSENIAPFWKETQPFFAVAKLHFTKSVVTNQAYRELVSDLEEHAKKYGCTCHAFRTIELSDMLLTVTAARLDALLHFTMTLRIFPSLGKVYTYASINYRMLKNPVWRPDEEDQIDLFSMRFSVVDFRLAANATQHIVRTLGQEPTYSVSGVDDIIINWQGLNTRRLVKLYRTSFLSQENLSWDQCFAEVISRVGIPLQEVVPEDKTGNIPAENNPSVKDPPTLRRNCDKLLEYCMKIRKDICNQKMDSNWMEPLFELVNTLVRISRTAVLDEFVYIMYAGVNAFLQNIAWRPQRLEEEDISQYQAFVENWAHLMEHIIRIEGQLTHNPELRPILYDIPIAMLEYTLSFLKEISELLQAGDDPDKAEIYFLLVPRLCDRIEAQELFPAIAGRLPGLVLVTIPLQSLYDAQTIQRELCHEVSHFAGEKYRNRNDRKKKYVQSAAALMAEEFFHNMHSAFIETIQERLMEAMCKIHTLSMVNMKEAVLQWADSLFEDHTVYSNFIREVLKKGISDTPIKLDMEDAILNSEKRDRFFGLMGDLSILYREIYADICMLYLLPLNQEEYIESLVRELCSEKIQENRRYEQFAIRIYVGLTASGLTIPWESMERIDEKLYQEVMKIHEGLDAEDEPAERLIPITSIYFILRYAEGCNENLRQQPQANLQKVREMFLNAVSPNLNYEQFLEYINQYRLKLLKE